MEWTATGSIRVLPGGEILVDLRGDIAGLEIVSRSRGAKSSSSVVAVPDADVQAGVDSAREALGGVLASLADAMVDLLARENKSNKVSLSKSLRQVYGPLVQAREKYGDEALAFGLEQAIAKGVPNANYAKKAAEGFRSLPVSHAGTGGRYDRLGE